MKGEFFKDYKTLLLLIHLLGPEGSPERICSLAQLTDAGIFLYSSQFTDYRSQTTDHKSQITVPIKKYKQPHPV